MDLPPGTALVRYETIEQLMRPRASPLLRVQLMAMWLVIAVGLYYIFQVSGYQRAIADIDSSQSRSISGLEAALTEEQIKMGRATGDLEKMSGQLSAWNGETVKRLNAFDQKLTAEDRATRQLMDRFGRLEADRTVAKGTAMAAATAAAATPEPAPAVQAPHNVASPANQHLHSVNMDLQPVAGAIVHTNAMKQKDYWLVPRQVQSGATIMVRVMPFEITRYVSTQGGGTVRMGVRVHSIEDGRDYTVTMAGEWINE